MGTERIKEIDIKVCAIKKVTVSLNKEIRCLLVEMLESDLYNYTEFIDNDKNNLRKIMNSSEALFERIVEVIQ